MRGQRGGPPGVQAPPRRGLPPGHVGRPPEDLALPLVPPLRLYVSRHPKTIKRGEFCEFRRRSMTETYKEEKRSPGGDSTGENTSRKGRWSPSSSPSSRASSRSSSTSSSSPAPALISTLYFWILARCL